jgi:hypothetical protein
MPLDSIDRLAAGGRVAPPIDCLTAEVLFIPESLASAVGTATGVTCVVRSLSNMHKLLRNIVDVRSPFSSPARDTEQREVVLGQ